MEKFGKVGCLGSVGRPLPIPASLGEVDVRMLAELWKGDSYVDCFLVFARRISLWRSEACFLFSFFSTASSMTLCMVGASMLDSAAIIALVASVSEEVTEL